MADFGVRHMQTADLQTADLQTADLQTADLQTCRLQTCRLQTCRLQTCRLQTCRLQTCRLQTCRLQTCRLQTCRLADLQTWRLQTADCDLGFRIKNCRLNYSSFNNTRPSMVIFPKAKCVFGGRQSSVIELVTPSQYCSKLLDWFRGFLLGRYKLLYIESISVS